MFSLNWCDRNTVQKNADWLNVSLSLIWDSIQSNHFTINLNFHLRYNESVTLKTDDILWHIYDEMNGGVSDLLLTFIAAELFT